MNKRSKNEKAFSDNLNFGLKLKEGSVKKTLMEADFDGYIWVVREIHYRLRYTALGDLFCPLLSSIILPLFSQYIFPLSIQNYSAAD